MDLNDLIPESDEIVITLKHPKTQEPLACDDGTPMTITMDAPHSKAYKTAVYAQADKRLKAKKEEMSIEELEQASVDLLVTITKTWNIQRNGQKVKPTKKEFQKAYEEIFWIKPQLEEALGTYEVFTKD